MKRLVILLCLLALPLIASCAPTMSYLNAIGAHGVTLAFDGLDVVMTAAEAGTRQNYVQLEGTNYYPTDPEDNCRQTPTYWECYRAALGPHESWRIEVDYIDMLLGLSYYADARFLLPDGTPGRVQAE